MIKKIIKFGSSTCGPCRQLKSELEGFNLVPIKELNIDEDIEADTLSLKYNIRAIPTLLFFDENDECVDRLTGYITRKIIEDKINENNSNL